MRQHLARPHFHFHPPGVRAVTSRPMPRAGPGDIPSTSNDDRWQVLKDKLAVAAVLLLVLATIAVFVLYLVHQAPYFGSGELTALATPMPGGAQQAAGSADAASSIAGSGLGRIPLILISTVVEMAIFVALGLYLRHDMKGKS